MNRIATITKAGKKNAQHVRQSVAVAKKHVSAWNGMQGMWKGKKMPNPMAWQRKIRNEGERKLL